METKYLNLSATTKAFWDQYNLSKKEGILLLKYNCINTSFLLNMDELKLIIDVGLGITDDRAELEMLNKFRAERYEKSIKPEIEAKVEKWKNKVVRKYNEKIVPTRFRKLEAEEK